MGNHVIISGGSGLIGGALAKSLRADGTRVVQLVRRAPTGEDEVQWDPGRHALSPDVLAGASTVVNLNGASIGKLPWTRAYRRALWSSRIEPTRTLADALRSLGDEAPKFVSASAVGVYGTRPGEVLDEGAAPGDTFLARLCVAWERAALSAGGGRPADSRAGDGRPADSGTDDGTRPDAGAGPRVALLRTAPLLDKEATLKPMIPLAKLGLSGPLGSGRQVWPWISLEDEVRAIRHIIDKDIQGPVNLTGPQAATAGQIGRELADELRKPFVLPAPGWALRMALGADAADSLLLADADVRPTVLEQTGFTFDHPTVSSAISAGL